MPALLKKGPPNRYLVPGAPMWRTGQQPFQRLSRMARAWRQAPAPSSLLVTEATISMLEKYNKIN
jgi:hypothetical protein